MTDNPTLYDFVYMNLILIRRGVGLYVSNDLDFENRDDKSTHVDEVMKTLFTSRS